MTTDTRAAMQAALEALENGCTNKPFRIKEHEDAIVMLRTALAVTPDAQPVAQDEFCWLVELFEGDGTGNSAGCYHTGFVDISGHSRTTKNPHQARRYATREQATQVAGKLCTTLPGTWRAVEHGFAAAPTPSVSAEPVAWLYVGEVHGDELDDWEIVAEQSKCERLNEAHAGNSQALPLYAHPPTVANSPAPER